MPDQAIPSLSPQDVRDLWVSVKAGDLSVDDVQQLMYKVDAKTQTLLKKTSPVPLKQSFSGSEDFTGRMTEFAKPVVKTMASDLAAPVLHPIDTAAGLVNSVAHPIRTAESMVDTAKKAWHGDPEAVGHALALAAAPKVYDTATASLAKGARAVADNPATRANVGTLGGGLAGWVSGGGWPARAMGAGAGRMLSPMLEGPARTVANVVDSIRAPFFKSPEAPASAAEAAPTTASTAASTASATPAADAFTPEQLEWLKKNHYTDDVIAKMRLSSAPPNSVRITPPGSPRAAATPTPESPVAAPAPAAVSTAPSPTPPPQSTPVGVGPQTATPPLPAAFQPFVKPDLPKPQHFRDFMQQVDAALEGAPSKSKTRSGFKNLSDNDAMTAAGAYRAGVRDPDQVIQAILDKRKNRQADHIGTYYQSKRETPE